MATAQLLTLTHGVNDVATKINDEIKGIDDKVTRIDGEVKGVGGKVTVIDDKIKVVHEGTQIVMLPPRALVNVDAARWKGNKSDRASYGKQR